MADDAFSAFARAAGPMLTRLAYGIVGDTGRAQDAAQTALERTYVRFAGLRDPVSYAQRVTINAARDQWRRVGRREAAGLLEERHAQPSVGSVEDRDELFEALRQLPVGQRTVVVLRHWLDKSEQETADLLGCSLGTVKSQNAKGLKTLKLHLCNLEDRSNHQPDSRGRS